MRKNIFVLGVSEKISGTVVSLKSAMLMAHAARSVLGGAVLALVGLGASALSATADPLPIPPAQILVQTMDLPDVNLGQDLWQFNYMLSGFNFEMNQGFTVFFGSDLFRDLQQATGHGNPDWDIIAVQPDLVLHQPGFMDGLALRNNASLAGSFSVNVVWLGQGTPGAQLFEIYDVNFAPLLTGQTVVVPEPTVVWLAGLGLAGWLARRRFAGK